MYHNDDNYCKPHWKGIAYKDTSTNMTKLINDHSYQSVSMDITDVHTNVRTSTTINTVIPLPHHILSILLLPKMLPIQLLPSVLLPILLIWFQPSLNCCTSCPLMLTLSITGDHAAKMVVSLLTGWGMSPAMACAYAYNNNMMHTMQIRHKNLKEIY